MDEPTRRRIQGLVGLIVGGLAAALLFLIVQPSGDGTAQPVHSDARAEQFATTWEMWRRAEVTFEEVTSREGGENQVSESVQITQRFPDSVTTSGSTVSARVGSRLVGCASLPGEPVECTDNGSYRPDEELELELAEIRTLTTGPGRVYDVLAGDVVDGGETVFKLVHIVDEFQAKWGERASFGFDTDTGVLISEDVIREDLTIRTKRTVRSETVSDDDLALPAEVRSR